MQNSVPKELWCDAYAEYGRPEPCSCRPYIYIQMFRIQLFQLFPLPNPGTPSSPIPKSLFSKSSFFLQSFLLLLLNQLFIQQSRNSHKPSHQHDIPTIVKKWTYWAAEWVPIFCIDPRWSANRSIWNSDSCNPPWSCRSELARAL